MQQNYREQNSAVALNWSTSLSLPLMFYPYPFIKVCQEWFYLKFKWQPISLPVNNYPWPSSPLKVEAEVFSQVHDGLCGSESPFMCTESTRFLLTYSAPPLWPSAVPGTWQSCSLLNLQSWLFSLYPHLLTPSFVRSLFKNHLLSEAFSWHSTQSISYAHFHISAFLLYYLSLWNIFNYLWYVYFP